MLHTNRPVPAFDIVVCDGGDGGIVNILPFCIRKTRHKAGAAGDLVGHAEMQRTVFFSTATAFQTDQRTGTITASRLTGNHLINFDPLILCAEREVADIVLAVNLPCAEIALICICRHGHNGVNRPCCLVDSEATSRRARSIVKVGKVYIGQTCLPVFLTVFDGTGPGTLVNRVKAAGITARLRSVLI